VVNGDQAVAGARMASSTHRAGTSHESCIGAAGRDANEATGSPRPWLWADCTEASAIHEE